MAHRVISQVADGAAEEARQAGNLDRSVAGHIIPDIVQRICHRYAADLAALNDLDPVLLAADDHGRGGAQKGVTPPFLATLDTLEEKPVAAVVDLLEGSDRGIQVGQNLPEDRNQVTLGGKGLECRVVWVVHGAPWSAAGFRVWERTIPLSTTGLAHLY